MAKKKPERPTAQQVISRHLGGKLVTKAMEREMLRMMQCPAWLTSWNRTELRIVYSCCGKVVSNKEKHLPEKDRAQAEHRKNGTCPYCGKAVEYLDCNKVRFSDIEEQYHVFYRRSRRDRNTLVAVGVWCGMYLFEMKGVGKEWRDEAAARIRPTLEACSLTLLPWAGTPRQWQRKPLPKWSSWFDRYVDNWKGYDDWRERSAVKWIEAESTDKYGAFKFVHPDTLTQAAEGTRWEKVWAWISERPNARKNGEDAISSLEKFCRHPQLEYMLTGGMQALAEAAMQETLGLTINWQAKTRQKMLPMLDSNELARLKRMDPKQVNVNGLKLIRAARKQGEKIKLEDAMELGRGYILNEDDFWDAARMYGGRLGVKRLARYLEHQKLAYGLYGVSRTWRDYMMELRMLGEDQDENRCLPKNLSESHRETSARVKIQKSELSQKMVAERAAKLRPKYSFAACGLVLEPFETVEEIIQEGAKQQICIANYAEAYAKGRKVLLKLRREGEEDKPFHAVEFTTGGKLVQCRGYQNRTWPEDEKQVRDFWAAWNEAKKQQQQLYITINTARRETA